MSLSKHHFVPLNCTSSETFETALTSSFAVGAVEKIYRAGGKEALQQTLSLIFNHWPTETDAIKEQFMVGVNLFCQGLGETLDLDRFAAKVPNMPAVLILRAAQIMEAKTGRGGGGYRRSQAVQSVLAKRYNSRKRR